MHEVIIDLPEASALLTVENRAFLETNGWDVAFWAALDEEGVEKNIALLHHDSGAAPEEGWGFTRPSLTCEDFPKNDDSETICRHGGYVYIFGSHFGKKDKRLRARRHFIARFPEGPSGYGDDLTLDLEVIRNDFILHRLINDALSDWSVELIPRGNGEIHDYIKKTIEKGKKKPWGHRIKKTDRALNIEGVVFLDDGDVLIGLRYPCTADGHPVLARVAGVTSFFDGRPDEVAVKSLHYIEGIGTPETPVGIRALELIGDEIHAIVGNLDSDVEKSTVLADHPEGESARCSHISFKFTGRGTAISAQIERRLSRFSAIEGIATSADGTFHYVIDDEVIRLLIERRDEHGRGEEV